MLIRDIRDKIDVRPGLSIWDAGVHRYAVDIFTNYIENRCLSIYIDASMLETVTEKGLLNGADNWQQYSISGNTLIYTDDICMRLFGRKPLPNEVKDWLGIQAQALQQAAQLILQAV